MILSDVVTMKTRCNDVVIKILNVPADDNNAVKEELIDVIENIEILPYDFNVSIQTKGEWIY